MPGLQFSPELVSIITINDEKPEDAATYIQTVHIMLYR
jgi:hypothetical protein